MSWTQIAVDFKQGYLGGSQKITLRYRDENGVRVWQKKFSDNLEFYNDTIDEAIEMLRSKSEDLTDARIDSDFEYGTYGDRDRDVVRLTGWQDNVRADVIKAAEAQIAEAPVRKQQERDAQKARAKEQMKRLLAEFPDLADEQN